MQICKFHTWLLFSGKLYKFCNNICCLKPSNCHIMTNKMIEQIKYKQKVVKQVITCCLKY